MTTVGSNYPTLLAQRGLVVKQFAGWETNGGGADHRAVVLHHTASGASTRPEDDAAYCHHGSEDSPLYNVLCDRTGVVWLLAGEKANSSGKISSVALNEALDGRADLVPASKRGLKDDTSNNGALFAISAQNNGTGEPWSPALNNAMAICSAVALQCLGLAHAGYVTTHRTLTSRKVDTPDGQWGCPADWHGLITNAMGGARPGPPSPAPGGNRELMLIEQPGRTVDPVRLACIELRPDDYQALGWNGASMKGDMLLKAGDNKRRGECRVLDLKGYTHNRILGWVANGHQGARFVTDGDGGTFNIDFS